MTFKGFRSLCVCALFLISMAVSASVFADPVHVAVHVQGTAAFEMRHTIVPRFVVQGQPPAQSKPYWVVVVSTTDGNQYELDGQYNLGDANKPAILTILGQSIEENAPISLDGDIADQIGNYIWLNDVTNVEPALSNSHQVILIPQQTDPFVNWTCQGQMDASTEIYADVWFQGSPHPTKASSGSYTVRLSTTALQGDNRQFSELAYLDSGSLQVEDSGTVFQAKTAQDSVSLEMSNSDAVQAAGVMSFSVHSIATRDIAAANDLQLSCTRNR